MTPTVTVLEGGALAMAMGGRTIARILGSRIPGDAPGFDEAGSGWSASSWEIVDAANGSGSEVRYRNTVRHNGRDLFAQEARCSGNVIAFSVELLRALEGLERRDAFGDPIVHAPAFTLEGALSFLLATYGLADAEDPFGGYWPEIQVGRSGALPGGAFAPLIAYDDGAALAVAPASQLLVSPLVATADGVARGLHGAITRLEVGTRIETVFAVSADPVDALMVLGDELLRRGGKERPVPSAHGITSGIGWWNAYGGYYTEPIRPLNEEGLLAVLADARQRGVPLAYLGLDLWYPYREIGQATAFVPDDVKYPRGLTPIAREASLPLTLHISALAQPNSYGADGSDGTVFEAIGDEIRRQSGTVVWHDWMRTQQHLSAPLRCAPDVADRWYRQMTDAFARRGLGIVQCMQTMGMALASSGAPNVIAARTGIDYLFSQAAAMDTLAARGEPGFRREQLPPVRLWRQNLLMGAVLYAVGLLPFHDLFLTRYHEDVGGAEPGFEAVLRALSCGPVGIGDAPGQADLDLLRRLGGSQGRLLRPDRPPFPMPESLGEAVEVYWTLHRSGDRCWLYVILLNLTEREQAYAVDPPVPGAYRARNGLTGECVEAMTGRLPAGGGAYYVLSPMHRGIAPLGLVDKLVPAPDGGIAWADADADGLRVTMNGLQGRFGVWSDRPVQLIGDGRTTIEETGCGLTHVDVRPDQRELRIIRR
jgi:hypothetical protein